MPWKLLEYVTITGTLTCKSGLHIGTGSEEGNVKAVMRNPQTLLPYVPGSSLRGKMRTLSEYTLDEQYTKGASESEPHGCVLVGCPVCRVFGPHKKTNHRHGPTRLIVRDCDLTPKFSDLLEDRQSRGEDITEIKSENNINRATGGPQGSGGGGLRTAERVPVGTQFDFTLSLRVFQGDGRAEMLTFIKSALEMVNHDALGGSGSRGYGWPSMEVTAVSSWRPGQKGEQPLDWETI